MDFIGLDFSSFTLIQILKILLTIFDLNSANGGFTGGTQVRNAYIEKGGFNTAVFMNEMFVKTVDFIKNNLNTEALTQINENINWKKYTKLKEEQLKRTQSRTRMVR